MDKVKVAGIIAQDHVKADSDITYIGFYSSNHESDNEPIKILEVNSSSISSGIVPITISPSGEIPLSTTIIEVTPLEFQKISNGELSLPIGWANHQDLYVKEKK